MNIVGRDRRLDELAKVEFTGSLGEACVRYGAVLRQVTTRWDTELGLASADARKALVSMRGTWLRLDAATRRVKARRVARRLRRAQTLVAALGRRAEQFPREYARQFLSTPQAAKAVTAKGMINGGGR